MARNRYLFDWNFPRKDKSDLWVVDLRIEMNGIDEEELDRRVLCYDCRTIDGCHDNRIQHQMAQQHLDTNNLD